MKYLDKRDIEYCAQSNIMQQVKRVQQAAENEAENSQGGDGVFVATDCDNDCLG